MIIIVSMMTIHERTAAMTAHLLKRIATQPDRRDKLHAARTEAIADRDWKAMNDITRRIAKLEPNCNGLKPLFSKCADCRTRPAFKTRQKAIAARPVGAWFQCCTAHVPGNKLPEPQRSQPSRFHDVEAL